MDNMAITEEIKQIRASFGCSQETLANIIGVGVRTIARWEHNEAHPHQLAIEKMKRVEKLIRKLSKVFERKEAIEWLNTPNQSLEGRTPLKEIAYNNLEGIEKIINLLGTIEWGIIT
jgi:transcriptional regulator with XRE-family HTH domain